MTARLLVGDVFDRMAELPDHSFDMILTSPPFLALRSYLPDDHPDKAKEIGSEATPAEFLDTLLALTAVWRRLLAPHGSLVVELGDTYAGSGGAGGDYGPAGMREGQQAFKGSGYRQVESDKNTRVQRDDHDKSVRSFPPGGFRQGGGNGWPLDKSLTGIPTLYTWSLAYGRNLLTGQPSPAGMWRIRNLKPWIRTNPPVGALGDKERPATSYITVATLARDRWFDLDAVRTASTSIGGGTSLYRRVPGDDRAERLGQAENTGSHPAGAPPLDWVHTVDLILDSALAALNGKAKGQTGPDLFDAVVSDTSDHHTTKGTHLRRALERAGILTTLDALDISPKGYAGAHYAVWPPELCQRLIDEMCPRRVCTTCGEPSRRIVESERTGRRPQAETFLADQAARRQHAEQHGYWDAGKDGGRQVNPNLVTTYTTVGWSDCGCEPPIICSHCRHELPCPCGATDTAIYGDRWRPGTVLDPFAGSGTTLAVATGMGRNATGIDLDPRSADLARERCGMFLEVVDRTEEGVA